MTAIQRYFEDAKQRKTNRSKISKKAVEILEKNIIDDQRLKHAYDTVKNWDDTSENLLLVYNRFNQNEYDYILSKRHDFSFEIKSLFWPSEFMHRLGKDCSLKIKNLSEKDYKELLITKIKIREKMIDDRISSIVIPSMSAHYLDEELVNWKAMLLTRESELEELKKKPKIGKYIAPSKRMTLGETNPEIISINTVIQNTKNEIEKIEQRIKVLNDDWERDERLRIRHQIEQELVLSGM